MRFAYAIGDEVDVMVTGRVIERTETEFGARYFLRLENGRKIGMDEEFLALSGEPTELGGGDE